MILPFCRFQYTENLRHIVNFGVLVKLKKSNRYIDVKFSTDIFGISTSVVQEIVGKSMNSKSSFIHG